MRGRVLIWVGIVLAAAWTQAAAQTVPIRFFNPSVINGPTVAVNEYEADFADSTMSDVLYQQLAAAGYPVGYFRKIKTSVCFDGKCRLLDITLYWTPTGSYHGFELPPGEFLSKTDHDPFSDEEYRDLHRILSDSLSPLADYTFDELVSGTGNPHDVDAVSSATLKDILDYIVPGAAYTTYRLWHMVHGKTTKVVSQLSDSLYSEPFAMALLASGQPGSQIWTLKRLQKLDRKGDELVGSVLKLTDSQNLTLALTALAALSGEALDRPFVQRKLADLLSAGDYALKKTTVLKLREAHHIDSTVRNELVGQVLKLNGDLLGELLNLFLKHNMTDLATIRRVSEVLTAGNRYSAGKAVAFLERINTRDEIVEKRLEEYRKMY